MSDEYDNVARGKLKLKTDSGKVSKKHKKSKKSKKDDRMENPSREKDSNSYTYEERVPRPPERQLTKAEISFKKQQTKMVRKIISSYNFVSIFVFRLQMSGFYWIALFVLFAFCSKRSASWKKPQWHINSASRNSTSTWITWPSISIFQKCRGQNKKSNIIIDLYVQFDFHRSVGPIKIMQIKVNVINQYGVEKWKFGHCFFFFFIVLVFYLDVNQCVIVTRCCCWQLNKIHPSYFMGRAVLHSVRLKH